ncbi:FCD domain-containing protein [Hoeflea alexandrii]|uniref:FCD domain-containing protein n=1 Tax=Hoeflea alexandrii TaxID=288436 RepID=A0ABT1CQX2_9HYPH|nr:GntR family transcriptional regulator [Hoeflea sp. EC-HK425]MBV6648485.1 GntR family transcriptional regulator [Hoeflea sp.]MCO6408604.1 FCD domain-containing protein [Hoeflea alexandrii]VVT34771.1 GntR family transcriptional regulator [Hoeflea sp. EC-HK425]
MSVEAKSKSHSIRAVDALRALIFAGELPPGSDHLESELAEKLGMSRTPVREATLVLESQGLLEVRPRKGVRISALSADDMREIYEVLTELESLAASLAADAHYSEQELSRLKSATLEMEASVAANDREGWARADAAFHDELVRLGGNKRIQTIVSNFNDQVRRARALTLHMRPMPKKSNEDHRALYEAIAKGDSTAARKIHWRHRTEAKDMLINLLNQHGLRRV